MFKIGICNELFEDMEFGQVCRLVKELGYDGLEIAPFTLAGLITDLSPERRRELKAMVEDAGLETIGLHWLPLSCVVSASVVNPAVMLWPLRPV